MNEQTERTTKRNGNDFDTTWHDKWLSFFGQTGNVTEACKAVGIVRATAYEHRDIFPDFAAAWEHAAQTAADTLEREAWRRAVEGFEEPVFGALGHNTGTGEVGVVRRFSDALLIFLLKGHKPEKFRERQELNVQGTIPVKHVILEDEHAEGGR